MSKEKKAQPIEGAEGFYVTKLLPTKEEPNVSHFKFSMPLYTYISVHDEYVNNPVIMSQVRSEAVDALIFQIEEQIKRYRLAQLTEREAKQAIFNRLSDEEVEAIQNADDFDTQTFDWKSFWVRYRRNE